MNPSMKRITSFLFVLALLFSLASACKQTRPILPEAVLAHQKDVEKSEDTTMVKYIFEHTTTGCRFITIMGTDTIVQEPEYQEEDDLWYDF